MTKTVKATTNTTGFYLDLFKTDTTSSSVYAKVEIYEVLLNGNKIL